MTSKQIYFWIFICIISTVGIWIQPIVLGWDYGSFILNVVTCVIPLLVSLLSEKIIYSDTKNVKSLLVLLAVFVICMLAAIILVSLVKDKHIYIGSFLAAVLLIVVLCFHWKQIDDRKFTALDALG